MYIYPLKLGRSRDLVRSAQSPFPMSCGDAVSRNPSSFRSPVDSGAVSGRMVLTPHGHLRLQAPASAELGKVFDYLSQLLLFPIDVAQMWTRLLSTIFTKTMSIHSHVCRFL